MEKKVSRTAKVVVLGEGRHHSPIHHISNHFIARVGKTSLTLRFCRNEFDSNQESTVDASYLERIVKVNEESIKLRIWDTAGQEKYHALNPVHYRGAQGNNSSPLGNSNSFYRSLDSL